MSSKQQSLADTPQALWKNFLAGLDEKAAFPSDTFEKTEDGIWQLRDGFCEDIFCIILNDNFENDGDPVCFSAKFGKSASTRIEEWVNKKNGHPLRSMIVDARLRDRLDFSLKYWPNTPHVTVSWTPEQVLLPQTYTFIGLEPENA